MCTVCICVPQMHACMHARCARELNVTTATWNNYKLTVIPPDGRDRPLRSSDLFVPERMLMIGEQRYTSEDFYSEEWMHKRDSLVICLAEVWMVSEYVATRYRSITFCLVTHAVRARKRYAILWVLWLKYLWSRAIRLQLYIHTTINTRAYVRARIFLMRRALVPRTISNISAADQWRRPIMRNISRPMTTIFFFFFFVLMRSHTRDTEWLIQNVQRSSR